MILSLTSTALQQESKPGSLYYRHPEYTVRWWWREFNRISYVGGREYIKPTRLNIEFDWPMALTRNADGTAVLDGNGRPLDPTITTTRYTSMLHRHNREKEWEYENRRRRAHYHNIVATTINMLVSHALKKGVSRDGDEELIAFWGAVDCQRKQDMDSFLREGIRMAEVEGIMWCFADVEKKDAEHPDSDGKPYVYWVNPLDIFDWSVDEDGELIWIKQFVYLEGERTPLEPIKPVHRFRIWYADKVEEYDCDPVSGNQVGTVKTIPHTFGRVPCEPLYAKRNMESNFPDGEPTASDLAKSANAIFNYTSLLDEILYKQTFSQLVLPTTQFDAIQLGLSTFIGYDPLTAGGTVEYIAPDAEQARVLMEAIVGELERARQAFGVGRGRQEGSMQKQSGDALELESEDKRSMLADIASSCSDFENRLVGLFNDMRSAGASAKPASITYQTEFDTRAFADEVNEALSLQSVGMSPAIMLAIRKQLAARKLAGLPEDERQKLIETLKETDPSPALEASAAKAKGAGADDPGRRNKLTPTKSVGNGSSKSDPNQAGPPGQGEPPP